MHRAYSLLQVKSFDEDQRIIRGIATTPEADRVGDIVVSTGVQFKNPSPLLWHHQHDKPVGTVNFDPPTARGITFEARLPFITDPGPLKDRIEEAWASIKAGLIAAVSIGFRVLDNAVEQLKGGGLKYLRTEVIELSLVTVPANASATITEIKSIDRGLLAVERQLTREATSMTITQLATVSVTKSLELELHSIEARSVLTVKLTRIEAQHLAEALLEFAGVPTKGYVQGRRCLIGVQDLSPVPREFRKQDGKTVKLLPKGTGVGVVRLTSRKG